MVSQKTIEIVKSTAPVLSVHGENITKVFYELLFKNHPELKSIFNMSHQRSGSQQKVLANAIFQYASYIDQLEMLKGAVAAIVQKHVSLSITPEMYPIVGENLLNAIKIVLGDAATDDIIGAWGEAYGALSSMLIQAEENIYKIKEVSDGGFRGKKPFRVIKKQKESEVVTSFYLKPVDGAPCPKFTPGQYIALVLDISGEVHSFTRNYSMSDVPNADYLRISVKKELGDPNGRVSSYLHGHVIEGDVLNIGMPSGEFVLKEGSSPVVLMAGGVGITPVLSMFKHLSQQKQRDVILIHCALNESVIAFQEEVREYCHERAKVVTVLESPSSSADYKGYLTKDIVLDCLTFDLPEFYFCGPTPFMANALGILEELRIPEGSINYEFFGPKEELELA